MSNAACVFCEILAGRSPGSLAYEDDVVVGLMDIAPVNPGHLMVIPRGHAPSLAELDEEVGAHAFRVALRLAHAVRRAVGCEGVNLFLADGEAAFQEVLHVHLHVLPRWHGDSFRVDADWSQRPSRGELDDLAARVRAAV